MAAIYWRPDVSVSPDWPAGAELAAIWVVHLTDDWVLQSWAGADVVPSADLSGCLRASNNAAPECDRCGGNAGTDAAELPFPRVLW